MSEEVAPTAPATPGVADAPGKDAAEKQRFIDLVLRGVLVIAGSMMFLGFFLPWMTIGTMMSVSGLGLLFTDGQMVNMISGANRFLLIAIPVFAVLLVATGALGKKSASWIAVGGGTIILGYGFFTLVMLFIKTTGMGMWLVIGSALMAFAIGLVSLGLRRAAR